jgi:ABC-type sugar transport system substrate-binding protein
MRKMLRILVSTLLVVVLLAAFSGVSAQDEPQFTIGATVPTLDAQFWNQYVAFMQEGADALGVELVVLNADNNPDEMASNIEDLVARGVDGIIHVPYWNTGIKVLNDAGAAGIPVILTDVYIEDIPPQDSAYPNYLAFVGPSDEAAGYAMANALFTEMRARGMDMVVGVVDGTPGTSVAIDRRKGFDRALAENPDVRLAGAVTGNFVRDESQTAFESLYQGNPDIKGVWAANGGTATGVMAALTNAGQTPGEDVLVVGMDLNPENVDAVEEGTLLFDIGGHWLQGGFALVMMYDHLNGLPIAAEEANVKLDLLPLTADLVPAFRADFPEGVPLYNWEERSRVTNPEAPAATFELTYAEPPTELLGVPMEDIMGAPAAAAEATAEATPAS